MPKKLTTFSMRMPEDINERIQEYAAEHECTKAEAMSHFVRAGMEIEGKGPQVSADDFQKLAEQLSQSQKEASQTEVAIVPADLRDQVSEYAKEHECTDIEAMGYFARLGMQMSAADRPASVDEVRNLSQKIDALAADSQFKAEQLRALAEAVDVIKSNTSPEEVELEGEIAEPELEEPEELTEEEKTRRLISEVMDEYAAKSRAVEPEEPRRQSLPWWALLLIGLLAVVILLVAVLIIGR